MKLEHETNLLVTESGQFFFLQATHFYSIYNYRTTVRLIQGSHNLQERGLSCPTGTYYTHHFSFIYNKVYSF